MATRKRRTNGEPGKAVTTKTEDRIALVMEMMERFEWKHSYHVPKLSAEWGVHQSRVEQIATEASRHIRLAVRGKPEDIRNELIAALRRVVVDAACGPRPSLSARVRAIDSIAELLGLKRHRVEIELDADLDRKMAELAEQAPPEVYRLVTSIFAGKGRPPSLGDGDDDGRDQDSPDGAD